MIKACFIILLCLACKNPPTSVQQETGIDTEEEVRVDSNSMIPLTTPIRSSDYKPKKSNEEQQKSKKSTSSIGEEYQKIEIVVNGNSNPSIKKESVDTVIDILESVQEPEEVVKSEEAIIKLKIADHSIFNYILTTYVKSGKVDYKGIKSSGKLDDYIQYLSNNPPLDNWKRNEKLAYWINAYNAFTIKLIVDNYPLESITDLHNGKPWDVKWIKIGSKSYSLNEIENEIIRPQFKEPRIHFAVNCAAVSCPPLASQAYTSENLEELMDLQTKAFINNNSFNQIGKSKITVSKIFEWYGVDFPDLISFLNKYSKVNINTSASVNYNEYNWALNSK